MAQAMQITAPGRASDEWLTYFRENAARLQSPRWDKGAGLSGAERLVVGPSIRIFQRGETGTGRTIERFARRWASRAADESYPEALTALFDEEARHAEHLGRFLELAEIPKLQREWSDTVFRALRHHLGLDGALSVLVSAEIVAKLYYRALHAATSSPLLRHICVQILRDETQHVRFQCQRLALLRARSTLLGRLCRSASQRVIFTLSVSLVGARHRSVFRAAGIGLRDFSRLSRIEWDAAQRVIAGLDDGAPTR